MAEISGMTLRDWFAGMALQGVITNPPQRNENESDEEFFVRLSARAYTLANQMIQERKKHR